MRGVVNEGVDERVGEDEDEDEDDEEEDEEEEEDDDDDILFIRLISLFFLLAF